MQGSFYCPSILLHLAAFDTINNLTLLIYPLLWFSVGRSVLKWFTSYPVYHSHFINLATSFKTFASS